MENKSEEIYDKIKLCKNINYCYVEENNNKKLANDIKSAKEKIAILEHEIEQTQQSDEHMNQTSFSKFEML